MRRKRQQRGFALLEILLALTLSSILLTSVGAALHQFTRASDRGGAQLSALHDLQNASFWLTRDGTRADALNLADGGPAQTSVTMTWTSDGQPHTVTYSLSGTQLQRDHNGAVTTVARHVINAQFTVASRLMTASITSSLAGEADLAESASFHIWLRPVAGGS